MPRRGQFFGLFALVTTAYMFDFCDWLTGMIAATAALAVLLILRRRERFLWEGHGRSVLITGCDTGFGYHLAKRLDTMGFRVFAGCLFPAGDGARELARECSATLKVIKLDVTKDEDVKRAKEFVQSNMQEKGLWAVVNNAGISDWSETAWNTISDYYRLAEVNLFGCIRTTIPFLPLVKDSKGRIVYVSSILAFFNCLNMGSYSMSKRGMEAFADCLRVEMSSFGVKVIIIQPGNFGPATNIVKNKTTEEIWDKLDHEQKLLFSKRYIELANEYFKALCAGGVKDVNVVVDAMVDALTSRNPKFRYLLVSYFDWVFFALYPHLPTFLTDAIFSLSPMYQKRKTMLYSSTMPSH